MDVFGVDENEHAPGICEGLFDRASSHAPGGCVYNHDGSRHINVRGEGLIQECSMARECAVYKVFVVASSDAVDDATSVARSHNRIICWGENFVRSCMATIVLNV